MQKFSEAQAHWNRIGISTTEQTLWCIWPESTWPTALNSSLTHFVIVGAVFFNDCFRHVPVLWVTRINKSKCDNFWSGTLLFIGQKKHELLYANMLILPFFKHCCKNSPSIFAPVYSIWDNWFRPMPTIIEYELVTSWTDHKCITELAKRENHILPHPHLCPVLETQTDLISIGTGRIC